MVGKELQKESPKERESEITSDRNYEMTFVLVKEEKEHAIKGRKVIKGKAIPFGQSRQGYTRWYCQSRVIKDTTLDGWNIFVHEIHTHSGKHCHQGGTNIFVLQGKGYTVVDGIRHDWREGDLILLPIKKGGVEHQHFNLDGNPSRWLALIHQGIKREFIGSIMEQRELSPDWLRMKR